MFFRKLYAIARLICMIVFLSNISIGILSIENTFTHMQYGNKLNVANDAVDVVVRSQLKKVVEILREYIVLIDDNLAHWNGIGGSAWRRYTKLNPLVWMHDRKLPGEYIKTTIHELQKEREEYLYWLGVHSVLLEHCQYNYSRNYSLTLHNNLRKLLHIADECAVVVHDERVASNDVFIDQLIAMLRSKGKLIEQHAHGRSWFKAVFAGAVVAGGAWYVYNNQEKLVGFCRQTKDSMLRFLDNHFITPCKNIWNIFYGTDQEKPLIEEEFERNSTEVFQYFIEEYVREGDKNLSEDEIRKKVEYFVEKRILPDEVMRRMVIERKHFTRNLVLPSGSLGQDSYAYLVSFLLKNLDGLKVIDEKLLQENRLNLQILLAIPALGLISGGTKALHALYNRIYDTKGLLKKCYCTLLSLERIILNFNDNEHDEYRHMQQLGVMHVQIHRIQQLLEKAPHDVQELFADSFLCSNVMYVSNKQILLEQIHYVQKQFLELFMFGR